MHKLSYSRRKKYLWSVKQKLGKLHAVLLFNCLLNEDIPIQRHFTIVCMVTMVLIMSIQTAAQDYVPCKTRQRGSKGHRNIDKVSQLMSALHKGGFFRDEEFIWSFFLVLFKWWNCFSLLFYVKVQDWTFLSCTFQKYKRLSATICLSNPFKNSKRFYKKNPSTYYCVI